MKNPSPLLKEWLKKLLLMLLLLLKLLINQLKVPLQRKLLNLKLNNQKKKFKEPKNLMMLKPLKLKFFLLKTKKTKMLKLNPLKILLSLLKKKKSPQNYYLKKLKPFDLLSQMLKIKLKTEKKPTLNQLLCYKKSKLLMELMLESKNLFNKPLIHWLQPIKKKPVQIQNQPKIILTELKMIMLYLQKLSEDNQDIYMMLKMPSKKKPMTNLKIYLEKLDNLSMNNN